MALQSRNRSTRLLVVTLVSLSLVTITLDYREGQEGPLAGLGRTALSVIAPAQEAVSNVTRPVGNFVTGLVELPSLRADNEQLRLRIQELERTIAAARSDEVRLSELTRLYELEESLGFEATTGAIVIGSGVDNFEWTITIDKGSSDGIKVNMPVIASAGLVGRVVRVTGSAAQVQLIIDPGAGVGARLVPSRETGILRGRGSADLQMQLVATDAPVEVQDAIETSGVGDLYPPGIPIGTVSRVLESPGALAKLVTVRPAVDFSSLEVVSVVLTPRAE